MVPTQNKQAVESHTNNVEYKGKLSKYQQEGNKHRGRRYMQYERDPFTEYQNFLYRRALYGLQAFPKEEVKYMDWRKKKRIVKVQKRARKVLNALKQEVVIAYTNSFFATLYNSTLARDLIQNFSEPDPNVEDEFTLKELNLTKVDVANRFIEVGILPKDFYELKKDPDARKRLPRLKQSADRVLIPG